ncbi:MAG: DUF1015 domain-containing protein [Anaerolineaceae bacterium]|nr:DUF1015 domain-containing protein [Anaerolineaceae bacterium]
MSVSEKIGVKVPEILLPKKELDPSKWAVIACDQFTSQPEYWEEAAKIVGEAPSTLHMILPEVWLHAKDVQERITRSQKAMKDYLKADIFERKHGFILVERSNAGKVQTGLMVALDLETYDFNKGSQTLIRATEGTILDRLPPRMQVRRGASLEMPHIMVLYDDAHQSVLKEAQKVKESLTVCYDFDLMMGSGHLKGYLIEDEKLVEEIMRQLAKLIEPNTYIQHYGNVEADHPLLFAMGDGNHSLATAKAIWEELKPNVGMNHPARYALVELVNLHDPSLQFEGIHRVMFNVDKNFLSKLLETWKGHVDMLPVQSMAAMTRRVNEAGEGKQVLGVINFKGYEILELDGLPQNLAVGNLQAFLDSYLKEHPESTIDYVHGDDVVDELGKKPGNIGFYLPAIPKESFFKTVILDGALPRKTFSMGHAKDKRFYMECREIVS